MSILKTLSLTFGRLNYAKTSYLYFMTTHSQNSSKKFKFSKNNFAFKSDFQIVNEENSSKSPSASKESVTERKVSGIYPTKNSTKRSIATKEKILNNENIVPPNEDYSKKKSSRAKTVSTLPPCKGEILHGIHPVYLALQQKKRQIFRLFMRISNEESNAYGNNDRKGEIESMATEQGIPISKVDSRTMRNLAPGMVHQGVCLDSSPLPLPEWYETDTPVENQQHLKCYPIWLVLNEILDPMNVGAIIRSAYYFGINEVFVVKGHSCKLSPTVSKASSGAMEVISIHQIENLQHFIELKKEKNWSIISTTAYCEENNSPVGSAPIDVTELKINKPTVLVLGSEGKGISSEILKLCDAFVSIPPVNTLHQGIDSLNVSVAAGVILHSLSTNMKNHL